jgi:hypothetical protein
MSLHAPLYCAICSAACALPRVELRPPMAESIHAPSSDRTNAVGANTTTASTSWLNEWHVLQTPSGICHDFHVCPSSTTSLINAADGGSRYFEEGAGAWHRPKNRCVPIHHYCLAKVLLTIRKSMYSLGHSHERDMMLAWSIPKWTGFGPWVHSEDRGGDVMARTLAQRGWVGYWGGLAVQMQRWEDGVPESHLLPVSASYVIQHSLPHLRLTVRPTVSVPF